MLNLDDIPVQFSTKAKSASVIPAIANKSILSLGHLCDNGCNFILLDEKYVSVIIDGVISIIGAKYTENEFWSVNLTPNGTTLYTVHPYFFHIANCEYAEENKTKILDFMHQAAFVPNFCTWTKVVNNNIFVTLLGLTAYAIETSLPKSINMAKGHMKTPPKNLKSTKPSLSIQHASNIMTTARPPPVEPPE